jgi:alkylhydroperoxidase/carboxymuconolactone decarboxylase family protein YurZ
VAEGILPGAVERNRESCGAHILAGPGISEPMCDMCFDAQTSGGLLIVIKASSASALLADLHDAGMDHAAIIGSVTGTGSGTIQVVSQREGHLPAPTPVPAAPSHRPAQADRPVAEGTNEPGVQAAYQAYASSVMRPGHLDVVTKQAINLALAVTHCSETALREHLKQAEQRGFTREEIDEAAWLGIHFGGEPARLFYQQFLSEIQ